MVTALMPLSVFSSPLSESAAMNEGAAALRETENPVAYVDLSGETQVLQKSEYEEVTSDTALFSDGKWYAVTRDVFVYSRIEVSGSVNLILCDDATLTADKGVHLGNGGILTVWGQSGGTGELSTLHTDSKNAGIGGNNGEDAGELKVNGGRLIAYGGDFGAGIGGGDTGNGGSVTVNGGRVEATGSQDSAGIGGGDFGSGGCGRFGKRTETAKWNRTRSSEVLPVTADICRTDIRGS